MMVDRKAIEKGLSLHNLQKAFGSTQAVAGVSFDLPRGKIGAILGPSGCGKSTVLALIAGLEKPDSGQIYWDGTPLETVPTHKRGFGLMFQDFALFPHMNVFDNVAFGLEMANYPQERVSAEIRQILDLVGLAGFEGRDVNTLSGGEQQRVALARSLIPHPHLLMLDEPLGALDRTLREKLLLDLGRILRRVQQTALYVTHDQEEAFALADLVVVMEEGRVAQIGTPEEIYRHPASLFVARFLGLSNFLEGEGMLVKGRPILKTEIGQWAWSGAKVGEQTVLLRPDAVTLNGTEPCHLRGKVRTRSFRGSMCRAVITIENTPLTFDFPSRANLPAEGAEVDLAFDPEQALQAWQ